jgi:Cu(I)-responsive transcriptional regulator
MMDTRTFNIGDAADASGVSAKMIRHYEQIGIIPRARRTLANYRTYSESDVHTLRFVRQARDLGFPLTQIQALLTLWKDRRRPSRKVKELAQAHIAELDIRIRELKDMKRTLENLAAHCHGDDRPDCPILAGLEKSARAPAASRRRRPAR